ncbi:MAG TPA: DUF1648 domain-containing protein [Terracidiphilus sp.]|nr:DUF1648 domain-containing protein [Terracidiphilus sp.]
MRTALKLAAFAALLALWAITAWAIAGPQPLPARIPTHFDIAGQPNGWGTPAMLWMLPVIATLIVGLMWLVSLRPGSFSIRAAPAVRRRVEAVSLSMIAWLQFEISGLFLWIQYAIVESARSGHSRLSPAVVPVAILTILGTAALHVWAKSSARRQMR